jgi:hypothetical protein
MAKDTIPMEIRNWTKLATSRDQANWAIKQKTCAWTCMTNHAKGDKLLRLETTTTEMATSICANLMELLQGHVHGGTDKRKQSGVESVSLPDQRYKERECYPENEIKKNMK